LWAGVITYLVCREREGREREGEGERGERERERERERGRGRENKGHLGGSTRCTNNSDPIASTS
jgi:hypothetical protein